jgi:PEP-CTERM motif-containing protein
MRTISWIVLTLLLAFCPAIASADTLLYTFTDHNDNLGSPLHTFFNGSFTLTFTLDDHGAGCSPGGLPSFFICGGVPVTSSVPGAVPSGSGVVFAAVGASQHRLWNYPNLGFFGDGPLYSGDITSPTFLTGKFTGTDDYLSNMDLVVTDISQPIPTPEPGSLTLMASGLVGLAGAIRRRR